MADLTLVFDGGSIGNPGLAYGSYRLQLGKRRPRPVVRLAFDEGTNNQAEYRALIAGLAGALEEFGEGAETLSLRILGDSRLIIHQLNGDWKVKSANLRPLHKRAQELLASFGSVELVHQPRRESVRALGH